MAHHTLIPQKQSYWSKITCYICTKYQMIIALELVMTLTTLHWG